MTGAPLCMVWKLGQIPPLDDCKVMVQITGTGRRETCGHFLVNVRVHTHTLLSTHIPLEGTSNRFARGAGRYSH